MAGLTPVEVRVQKLDDEGKPVGDPIAVAAASIAIQSGISVESATETLNAVSNAFYEFSVQTKISAKAMQSLYRHLFQDERAYRRFHFYHKHGYAHAPRRRNKHGRTGVRR
jgi:hypothetical protein